MIDLGHVFELFEFRVSNWPDPVDRVVFWLNEFGIWKEEVRLGGFCVGFLVFGGG